jgi:hypothetical protein
MFWGFVRVARARLITLQKFSPGGFMHIGQCSWQILCGITAPACALQLMLVADR